MHKYTAGIPMQFFFFFAGTVLWAGIWLTGFSNTHWLLYVPAILLYFAAVTGICPVLIFSQRVFGNEQRNQPGRRNIR